MIPILAESNLEVRGFVARFLSDGASTICILEPGRMADVVDQDTRYKIKGRGITDMTTCLGVAT